MLVWPYKSNFNLHAGFCFLTNGFQNKNISWPYSDVSLGPGVAMSIQYGSSRVEAHFLFDEANLSPSRGRSLLLYMDVRKRVIYRILALE